MNTNLIFVSLLLLIVFSIMSKTNSILFMLEMTVLFVTPFLLLIVLRFSTDNLVLIDSIKQSLTYFMHLPKMNSVVSSLFVFTGFTNLLVFSQHIQPFNRKHLIIISTVVCLVLYAAYFIPIGYFGLNGVGVESYVWVTTIDSMRIDYFFLERLVIIFILILIGITLMYIIISFHSSLKFFQMMTRDFGGLRWIVIFIIVLSGFITQYYLEEFSLLKFFHSFFIFRIISDLSLLGIFFYASRKQIKT
ncbi:hypothetical protein BALCAV_0212905 [Alkalihalobacillus alcalophilus ATCC 27647 = CGMCC 1.3604]|uniref:Uncharacterized protein n=1 Tax=Alkalihalobacillus alcalophilus ATCC 27647 = CGMCC 1.3604 TaxID=1218173 RepID=A0A094WJH4_ALKAL|nr:hypothetical protein BALCAV_0212905 [Alkalihalobacillus alcalophilus ATCC 27647 = CGMCC 1.3604]